MNPFKSKGVICIISRTDHDKEVDAYYVNKKIYVD